MQKKVVTNIEILKRKCLPAALASEIEPVVSDLIDTFGPLRNRGCGLAANQIGYNICVSLLQLRSGETMFLINPEIIERDEPIRFIEGCFSFPGMQVTTRRYNRVKIRNWTKALDKPYEFELTGVDAIAAQHEIDHLNGVVFMSRKWRAF